jgi:heterotetrameric sarcosine oxidase gamma subunit
MGVPFGGSRLHDEVLISGQRPGEWLLLGSATAIGAAASSIDQTGHVSIVDHTHSRALFRLVGETASGLLEKVCSLDWSDAMTPNGAVVSASVAKVTCDIVRNDHQGTPSYLIACDRSFAQYLFDAVLDAGKEFDIGANV